MQEQTSTTPRQNYTERLEARRAGLAIRERRHSILGNLRGLVFLAGVALAFAVFAGLGFSPWWLLLPVASFWWFGWQLELAESARTRFSRGVTYYERALARLDHRWSGTGEGGECFLDERERHLFASDLDIFGRGSLFELLCQARTHMGQEVLSEWLLKPATPDVIRARQEAVKDMAPRLDLREDLAVLGENARSGIRAEVLYAWGERQPVLEPSWFRVLAWGLSVLGAMGVIAFLACLMVLLSILKLPEKTVVGLKSTSCP